MADVKLDGLGKQFGGVTVVRDVNLAIPNGEFLVLVGPSGCGKSTLLRMVAGLERASEGEIRIGGRKADDLPPQKRNIAMVFQSYALYPHMTARENIAYGPKLRGEAAGEVATKVDGAAGVLNLFDYLERYPRQLSGGQRQRVAMGRALVRQPDVFLFDEPLSNLDAKLRVQMRAEVKNLHKRIGTTSIYVTHDQIEAMTMADRIVVLNHGKIEQIGAPLDLYDRPANLFVAGFLGSPAMSFLEGRLERDGAAARVVLDDASGFDLPAGVGGETGQVVVLGVRPEQAELVAADGVPVAVETIEPTGAETYIYGRLAGQPISIVVHRRERVQPGDTVGIRAAPDDLHLFDAVSGRRL